MNVWTAALACLMTATPALAASGSSPFAPAPTPDLTAESSKAVVQPTNPDGKPHQAQAALLQRAGSVAPGSTGQLGIHLEHQKDWHTYWKSPGDIGLPTTIEWRGPEGFSFGEQVHPIPIRFENEGIVSYGYADRVLHIVPLTVAPDVAPGTYAVEADVGWLICKTSCVPGNVTLSTEVVVGAAGEPTVHEPVFSYWEGRHAGTATPGLILEWASSREALQPNSGMTVAVKITASEGTLDLPETAWPTFTPIATSYDYMIESTTFKRTDDGGAVMGLTLLGFEPEPLPETLEVGGLLQVKVGDTWVRSEVYTSFPWAAADATVADVSSPVLDLLAAPPVAEEDDKETEDAPPATVAADGPPASMVAGDPIGLGFALFMSFVGGLILNIMPCVLPVLLLKLYSLIEQAGISDQEKRTAGLAYTGGILVSFWALALAVVVARTAFGESVGWGFQMQSPAYVATITTAIFLFGLSMFGVFEIPAFGENQAHELSSSEGPAGYFFTGVFATLVATPCSAPFLGTAISFGFQAPTAVLVAVFTLIGLGLAAPFLLVAFIPAMYKLLPQPGPWMETFKELLGFALVATAIWLVDVYGGLTGQSGQLSLLIFLLFSGIAGWVFGRFGGVAGERTKQLGALGVSAMIMLLSGYTFLELEVAEDEVCDDGTVETASLDFSHEIPWQRFSESRLASLEGSTVFIDFTADWCVSCKVNEKTVLETEAVRKVMAELNVVPLVADWTRKNDEITAWLQRYQRAGVPMYLVVPPSGPEDAILLPEVITTDMVNTALREAARPS